MPRESVETLKDRIDELEAENESLSRIRLTDARAARFHQSIGRRGGRRRGGRLAPACGAGWRKEAHEVTDRRLRQRAVECRPAGKHCLWCGATVRLMVAHVDGNESNGAQENLGPTCRSCNAKVAHVMKRHGMGRRTRQYNPRARRSTDLGSVDGGRDVDEGRVRSDERFRSCGDDSRERQKPVCAGDLAIKAGT